MEVLQNETENQKKLNKTTLIFLFIQLLLLLGVMIFMLKTGDYGFSLFLIIPFSIGLTIGTYSRKRKKVFWAVTATTTVIISISGILFIGKWEGVICILMSAVLLIPIALIGTLVGYMIRKLNGLPVLIFIFLINTSAYVYDTNNKKGFQSLTSTSLIITAPREKIWNVLTHKVTFGKSKNVFLRLGVSHPLDMQLSNTGKGSMCLVCNYSNGFAQLKIEQLDTLKRMRFSTPDEIKAMREMTFYDTLEAAHLQGYMKAIYGEFVIDSIDAEHCRLEANTLYTYKIEPEFYWKLWSNYLVDAMHRDVLNDIKQLSEDKHGLAE